jgi:hypothetical protein
VLGLTVVAGFFSRQEADAWLLLALGGAGVLALLGSLAWSLDGAPGGRALTALTIAALAAALCLRALAGSGEGSPAWRVADDLTSAALLGSATTAMLLGHSYLVAPGMSLVPLLRLLGALFAATGLRMALAGFGLWSWTADHSLANLNEVTIWLPLRWGLGLIAPLALGWMAWQTARIRSTQSATGILYVVVIFCFLGELTSQLLVRSTGLAL